MNPDTGNYIISGGQQGKSRLNILSDVLYNDTKALLEKCGVAAGMSFLDIGCGGGNVALMAAKLVGNTGSITALDFDEEIISLCRADAAEAGIHNISFRAASAYDMRYDSEFDVCYARFLLSHLKRPMDVLRKIKQSIKPGGKVIVEDVHFSGHFSYPVCAAFDQYVQYYKTAAKHNGADADIGPSLFSMFQQAGLEDVGFDVIQPCFSAGAGKWMGYITMDKIKNTLITHGLAIPKTIDDLLQELEIFTKNEQTIISLPRIFRVWGTRK